MPEPRFTNVYLSTKIDRKVKIRKAKVKLLISLRIIIIKIDHKELIGPSL
jgi:hypothetical protein